MNFRSEAYKVILRVFKDGDFSDTLLQRRAKKLKDNKEEIALFYTTVKGVVKMRQKLDFVLSFYTEAEKYETTDLKIKIIDRKSVV